VSAAQKRVRAQINFTRMAFPEGAFSMLSDWHVLSNETQLTLARAALQRAAAAIAGQAELLADEIETGAMTDPGGADALRLLAAVVRGAEADPFPVAGHC
jgi:predicted homoserine dehydrogenase-like protein